LYLKFFKKYSFEIFNFCQLVIELCCLFCFLKFIGLENNLNYQLGFNLRLGVVLELKTGNQKFSENWRKSILFFEKKIFELDLNSLFNHRSHSRGWSLFWEKIFRARIRKLNFSQLKVYRAGFSYIIDHRRGLTRASNWHCEFALLRKIAKAKRICFAEKLLVFASLSLRFRFAINTNNSYNCEFAELRKIAKANSYLIWKFWPSYEKIFQTGKIFRFFALWSP